MSIIGGWKSYDNKAHKSPEFELWTGMSKEDIVKLDDHCSRAPGLIGMIAHYIYMTSTFPNWVSAVSAAIALLGMVKSHKIRSSTNIRTNMMSLTVGTSGVGKDSPQKAISALLDAAKMGEYLSGIPASHIAIYTGLRDRQGKNLIVADEFAGVLQALKNPNASNYESSIINHLMLLYSCANSFANAPEISNRSGKVEGDKIKIVAPSVNICANTTPKEFFKLINGDDILSGWLGRWDINMIEIFPMKPNTTYDSDEANKLFVQIVAVLEWWRAQDTYVPSGDGDMGVTEKSIVIDPPIARDEDPELMEKLMGYYREVAFYKGQAGNVGATLYTRLAEQVMKIALIGSEADLPTILNHNVINIGGGIKPTEALTNRDVIITSDVFEWAAEYVIMKDQRIQYIIENKCGSDKNEEMYHLIKGIIKESGEITRRELCRRTNKTTKEIEDTIKSLWLNGHIRTDEFSIPGRPKHLYVWLND
jgi:hypothetical protein